MRRAQRRKYHFIYKTTCLITNKYYYGMHSTDNLDDGYLGSGKRLKYSINKHGKNNHVSEKIEFFDNRKDLIKREIEIVNEELMLDPLCMNLKNGGEGGLGFISDENQLKRSKAGGKRFADKLKNDEEFSSMFSKRSSETFKKTNSEGKIKYNTFSGRNHSAETKEKMRNADRSGNKNSQYGTCWITNGNDNKKIYKGDTFSSDWRLGRTLKLKS